MAYGDDALNRFYAAVDRGASLEEAAEQIGTTEKSAAGALARRSRRAGGTMTTLVVTNDFPPRIGGIESFVALACRFLDDDVAVLTSTAPGSAYAETSRPATRSSGCRDPCCRLPPSDGPPSISCVAAGPTGCCSVPRPRWRCWPLPSARPERDRIVALTHGHETWWATLPGSRTLLRRIGDEVDVLTTISDYVTERIAAALSPAGRAKLVRLPPPVDLDVFRPALPPTTSGARTSIAGDSGTKRVVGVGRMVRRKGFDTLLDAWGLARRASSTVVGQARELVLVGDGPERGSLRAAGPALAARSGEVHRGPRIRPGCWRAAAGRRLRAADPHPARRAGSGGSRAWPRWRPPPAGCRSWSVAPAARPRPSSRVVRATSSNPMTRTSSRPDSATCSPIRITARALGAAGRAFVGERYGAEQARRVLRTALGLPGVATV